MQVEAAKPEDPAKEASAETPAAPAARRNRAPVANAEVKLAAIAETPEPAAATPPAPEPATDISSFEGNVAAARIATLGGPAVIVDEKTAANATEAKTTEAKTTEAKPDQSAVRKQAAERARERRRIAARRVRLAREAALAQQQLQANPFAHSRSRARRGSVWIGDQAGPVATGGPSAAPHSVHEPSYSAGFSTPRR